MNRSTPFHCFTFYYKNFMKSYFVGQYIGFHRRLNTFKECNTIGNEVENKPATFLKIVFFGTDNFSVRHLQALRRNSQLSDQDASKVIGHIRVVTSNQLGVVARYANETGIPVSFWPLKSDINHFDVGVVVSFGHMIPARVINMFPYGVLNLHPSLLPRWRGASPLVYTLLSGDSQCGVTLMKIRPKKFDVGPIVCQKSFLTPQRCTVSELAEFLALAGIPMLLSALENLPSLHLSEQPNEGATLAPKVSLTNANIDWESQTIDEIDRQYRALGDMFSLRNVWKGAPVKLLQMIEPSKMQEDDIQRILTLPFANSAPPGRPVYLKRRGILAIKCLDGWVGFREILFKRRMSAKDFFNGQLSDNRSHDSVFLSCRNEIDFKSLRTDR